MHAQGHVNEHTHQIHQNLAMREKAREGRRRDEEEHTEWRQAADAQAYLFVHFDVEAIRHLVVLGRTQGHISQRNSET